MPVVSHTLRTPGGEIAATGGVMIQLVAAVTTNAEGHVLALDQSIGGVLRPSVDPATGTWTATLTGNADITPAGTTYRITEVISSITYTFDISVPATGGPYKAEDLLEDPPATLASPAVSTHITNPTGAHAASAISTVPAGTLAATNVQTALAELDAEKLGAGSGAGGVLSGAYPNPGFAVDMAEQSELVAHEADSTNVHGIVDTGALVTLAGAQTITGLKTFSAHPVVQGLAAPQPVWAVGEYRRNSSSGVITLSEFMYLVPMQLPTGYTIDQMGLEVTTAGAAGAVLRMGIYDNIPATCWPGPLLIDAGTIAADTIGYKSVSFAATGSAQSTGLVWLALVPQVATGVVMRGGSFDFQGTPPMGNSSGAGLVQAAKYNSIRQQTKPTGALPASFPAFGAGGVNVQTSEAPSIAVRRSA